MPYQVKAVSAIELSLKKELADQLRHNAAEQWMDLSIPHNKMMPLIYLAIPEIDNGVPGIDTKMELRKKPEVRSMDRRPDVLPQGRSRKEPK